MRSFLFVALLVSCFAASPVAVAAACPDAAMAGARVAVASDDITGDGGAPIAFAAPHDLDSFDGDGDLDDEIDDDDEVASFAWTLMPADDSSSRVSSHLQRVAPPSPVPLGIFRPPRTASV